MQTINNRSAYGWLSIALHWLAALAIFYLLWTGFNSDWAQEAGDRATHRAWENLHASFGVAVWLLLLARVVGHYAQPQPEAIERKPLLKWLASATHHVLLLAILLQIVTGPLIIWTMARPLEFWTWFTIPSPFTERHRDWHEAIEAVHKLSRWPIIAIIGLHILGGLKHAIIDRDGVLRRILIPGSPKA